MSRKEKSLVLLVALLIVTAGTVLAKSKDDFCQSDYDRLLKGDKNMVGARLEGANLKVMDLIRVYF